MKIEELIKEAKALASHPSKDCRSFAEQVLPVLEDFYDIIDGATATDIARMTGLNSHRCHEIIERS